MKLSSALKTSACLRLYLPVVITFVCGGKSFAGSVVKCCKFVHIQSVSLVTFYFEFYSEQWKSEWRPRLQGVGGVPSFFLSSASLWGEKWNGNLESLQLRWCGGTWCLGRDLRLTSTIPEKARIWLGFSNSNTFVCHVADLKAFFLILNCQQFPPHKILKLGSLNFPILNKRVQSW